MHDDMLVKVCNDSNGASSLNVLDIYVLPVELPLLIQLAHAVSIRIDYHCFIPSQLCQVDDHLRAVDLRLLVEMLGKGSQILCRCSLDYGRWLEMEGILGKVYRHRSSRLHESRHVKDTVAYASSDELRFHKVGY